MSTLRIWAMMVYVDGQERASAAWQLEVYELLEVAMGRRDEVFEIVDSSEDAAEAHERIGALFGVQNPKISEAVLDLQVSRWTRSDRKRITDTVADLRRLLDG
jgi:DNA gyrase/topoisomerase IV subunit A